MVWMLVDYWLKRLMGVRGVVMHPCVDLTMKILVLLWLFLYYVPYYMTTYEVNKWI